MSTRGSDCTCLVKASEPGNGSRQRRKTTRALASGDSCTLSTLVSAIPIPADMTSPIRTRQMRQERAACDVGDQHDACGLPWEQDRRKQEGCVERNESDLGVEAQRDARAVALDGTESGQLIRERVLTRRDSREPVEPDSFVTAVRVSICAGLVSVTVTPGSTPPWASFTSPEMLPVELAPPPCAPTCHVNNLLWGGRAKTTRA